MVSFESGRTRSDVDAEAGGHGQVEHSQAGHAMTGKLAEYGVTASMSCKAAAC